MVVGRVSHEILPDFDHIVVFHRSLVLQSLNQGGFKVVGQLDFLILVKFRGYNSNRRRLV